MKRIISKYKSLSRLKRIFVRIVTGLFLLLLFISVSAEFTSRPNFCSSCHNMEPYYESWKTSSHNEIECAACHFPPGLSGTVRGKLEGLVQVVNYLGGSYVRRKPWAEITDASCLESGCHESRLLKGKVPFKNVVFDHEAHLGEMRRGKNLRCTSCHSQIVQGDHMVVTETTCFLCHFKKGGEVEPATFDTLSNCQTCHHWESLPKEEIDNFRYDHTEVTRQNIDCTRCHNQTIIGDGFVPRENCYSCHFDQERLSKIGETALLHNVHIAQHKIECIQCHLRIQHKVQRLTADSEVECGTCHSSTHNEQLFLFAGEDLNGVKGIPNPMFEAGLNCASCHMFHENLIGEADVKTAKPMSCEVCHGEGYANLLRLWEETADKKIVELNRIINRAEKEIQKVKADKSHEVLANFERAKYGMHVVEAGKAIHNMTYSDAIISKSYEYLGNALKAAKSNFILPKLPSSAVVPSECSNCHTGIEQISRAYNGKQFSHQIHMVDQQVKCNTCHSNARKHGELIFGEQGCNACHHQASSLKNCEGCHKAAEEIYIGELVENMAPDIMQEAQVECAECHLKDNQVVRPTNKICLDCHDDGYDEMADGWQEDISVLLNSVTTLVDSVKSSSDFVATDDFIKLVNVFNLIQKESAIGVHNYELSLGFLEKAQVKLQNMLSEKSGQN